MIHNIVTFSLLGPSPWPSLQAPPLAGHSPRSNFQALVPEGLYPGKVGGHRPKGTFDPAKFSGPALGEALLGHGKVLLEAGPSWGLPRAPEFLGFYK